MVEFDFDTSKLTDGQIAHLRQYWVKTMAQFLDILRDQRITHMAEDWVPGPRSALCEECEEIASVLQVG